MTTVRLSLSKGIVLIPGNKNSLELIEILRDTFNGVRVKFLKTDSVVILDGSVATKKPSIEWISNEIAQKNNELIEIKEYINKLKEL